MGPQAYRSFTPQMGPQAYRSFMKSCSVMTIMSSASLSSSITGWLPSDMFASCPGCASRYLDDHMHQKGEAAELIVQHILSAAGIITKPGEASAGS